MWNEDLNVFTNGDMPKAPATKVIRAGLPRRARNFSKEQLQKALRKKKECNDKAQRVVETLIEPGRTEHEFLVMLRDINQCHMEDIVQERAIMKICGYSLCDNELKDIPKQKYVISVTKKKVYDITERKKFCSGECYKASNYIKEQMLTSPLWLRDQEDIPDFQLLNGRQQVYPGTEPIRKEPLQAGDNFGDLKVVERTYSREEQEKMLIKGSQQDAGTLAQAAQTILGVRDAVETEGEISSILSRLNISDSNVNDVINDK